MDIILDRVCKRYGDVKALDGLSHRFPERRFSCILGPSGCGKTTLLRLVAGLEAPDEGAISGAEGKKISAVFQEDRLFEALSAEKNLLLTAAPDWKHERALDLLRQLGLGDCASAPVHSFSGGMRRRVALARALAADYDLLLLDEPFSGLDAQTRAQAIDVLRQHASGRSVLLVIHDSRDAEALGADVLNLFSGSAR